MLAGLYLGYISCSPRCDPPQPRSPKRRRVPLTVRRGRPEGAATRDGLARALRRCRRRVQARWRRIFVSLLPASSSRLLLWAYRGARRQWRSTPRARDKHRLERKAGRASAARRPGAAGEAAEPAARRARSPNRRPGLRRQPKEPKGGPRRAKAQAAAAPEGKPTTKAGVKAAAPAKAPHPQWYWTFAGNPRHPRVDTPLEWGAYQVSRCCSRVFPLAMLILAVLGSIVSGSRRPEADAVGAVGGFVLGRRLTFARLAARRPTRDAR